MNDNYNSLQKKLVPSLNYRGIGTSLLKWMEINESKLAFYSFEINNLNFKFRLKMFIALKKLEKNVKKCDKEIHHVALQLVTAPNSMPPLLKCTQLH